MPSGLPLMTTRGLRVAPSSRLAAVWSQADFSSFSSITLAKSLPRAKQHGIGVELALGVVEHIVGVEMDESAGMLADLGCENGGSRAEVGEHSSDFVDFH